MAKYDDDDDDDLPIKKKEQGPLDGMFANTSMVVLVIFAVCCSVIAFILRVIAVATAKDPTAKSNATVVLIISAIFAFLGIVAQIMRMSGGLGAGFR
jgi:hypothetical protein